MPDDFDPASLARYSVILLPYRFQGGYQLGKVFVVLTHQKGYAICLKATSQTELYENDKALKAGCVYYEAGEVSFFRKSTAIQPSNQIPVSHQQIREAHKKGALTILGRLPADFHRRLIDAINNSIMISPRERTRLLEILEE